MNGNPSIKIDEVVSYIRQFEELDGHDKCIVVSFIANNFNDIEIDCNVVEGGLYGDDYYNVILEGPNDFYLEFDKGCDTDYLNLLELRCEGVFI